MRYFLIICLTLLILAQFAGCGPVTASAVKDRPLSGEADWIRNGEPIVFEGENWYPQDGIETFIEGEVIWVGEYRGVDIVTDKVDVRPFERLYTKYGKNEYRYFLKRAGK
ncbi:MAG: hypothetical protein HQL27_03625 [Candidatus Omnitrophica bacterium]|nr:hypothetical protein [Candidatus Omnitrophota bacterium]